MLEIPPLTRPKTQSKLGIAETSNHADISDSEEIVDDFHTDDKKHNADEVENSDNFNAGSDSSFVHDDGNRYSPSLSGDIRKEIKSDENTNSPVVLVSWKKFSSPIPDEKYTEMEIRE